MKELTTMVIALCTIVSSTLMTYYPAVAGDYVGVREIAVPSRERGRDLAVTVWYPANAEGDPVTLGESIFFVGTPAWLDGPISDGRFPLILLSHGAGLAGNAQALSWIAVPLAQQGFIVAAPTHPGNSGASRSAAETMKLWLRPADITETLNAMEDAPLFKEHLEFDKTGILGLSMGGGTALAIAGARIDPERLASYCDTDALNPSLCDWVRQSGVDLHAMDLRSAGRDNHDARIGFAMAIDPAPADVFEIDSLSRISIPVALVNLGQPGKIPPTLRADEIANVIPNAKYSTIEDASHYSMFAECRPGAAEIAESEKIGDPICSDGGGRSRREIHVQLIDMVVAAFSRALK
ncbi:putative dienelactone hydrolase [Ciceribacter lividus]|uniref:Putative dienelactone hydrolase n=1 Tax=Ciceribacter lividus TaxID=1197950 RepID=A0A6I7HRM9_9HYPH|nr:alpha/beta fold hydrolase [Ciceribacter lividus]RCW27865.1 putative dienelactone hydrolase [Ciceribacter lividus]